MNDYLADPLLQLEPYKRLLEDIKSENKILNINGILEEGLGHFIYSLNNHQPGAKLILTYDSKRAQKIYEDLKNLGLDEVCLFTQRSEDFFESFRRSMDDIYSQINAMYMTIKSEPIIVATLDSVLDKLMDKDRFESLIYSIDLDSKISIEDLNSRLIDLSYEKVSQVEAKGQFSIRGDIIDIYIPIYDSPVRIELFDIEIDSIRYFDLASQRSKREIDAIDIVPCREFILSEDKKGHIKKNIQDSLDASKLKDDLAQKRKYDKFSQIIDKLDFGMEIGNTSLISGFLDKDLVNSIVDYMDLDSLILVDQPKRIEDRVEEKTEVFNFKFQDLYEAGEVLEENMDMYFAYEDVVEKIQNHTKLTFNNIIKDNKYYKADQIYFVEMKKTTSYNGRIDIFEEEIKSLIDQDYKVLILSKGPNRIERIEKTLKNLNIKYLRPREDTNLDEITSEIILQDGSMTSGIQYPQIKYAILNHNEIYAEKKQRKTKKKSKESLDFATLKPGDFIVHENHGIGIYMGTEQMEIQDVKKDYIMIHYQGADRLYIPTDQLSMLHKYQRPDGKEKPKINKLNSVEWQKTKAQAQKSIDDMADELINLYSKRESQRGFAFSEDSLWQEEFEDSFKYQETPGQIESIEEIKADMENIRPMDRLLCADVGFGKTEVALRASFKAVMDSKQVAFLVPTTILAQQHYQTMVERFKDFPVRIAVLSRFRTDKEIKEDLLKLEMGQIDIIVGTHRLLSKDVVFKDLGLLIIDEEQRFGVRHKETLKMLKENVDTLTLSATPIPRTLQMSMAGIRDMSTIEEPPKERFPVQTYVSEYNPNMIKDAIERELNRGGQVFFVYNRVASLDEMARRIKDLVPHARVQTAHGQISENLLEERFVKFLNKEIDILVSTTIIETGLDIQNANTIIVYEADKYGLSQLYQLRGRVGRSDRIAYAYFTFKDSYSLSEVAEKRLMAIREFIEFGSGYQIALRDLEIRGAGNILGSQQSGHINKVGYDLYMSLLEESVKKRKGEDTRKIDDTTVDINIGAYIPKDYIKDEIQRLETYKKISKIESDENYLDLQDELIDRYGDIPIPVLNLLEISHIKYLANQKNIATINASSNTIEIEFISAADIDINNLNEIIYQMPDKVHLNPKRENYIKIEAGDDLLQDLKEFILQL